jgi:hypothetical protein
MTPNSIRWRPFFLTHDDEERKFVLQKNVLVLCRKEITPVLWMDGFAEIADREFEDA